MTISTVEPVKPISASTRTRAVRGVVALATGCLLLPLVLLLLLEFGIPTQSRGYSNPDFWLSLLAGSILGAVVAASFKRRVPVLLVASLGPLGAALTVAVWAWWSISQGAT